MSKKFAIELNYYGNEIRRTEYDKKSEQLEHFYKLISLGYKRNKIVKKTIEII